MKSSITTFLAFFFITNITNAQVYSDYFGAGHNIGISVSSSNSSQEDEAAHTLNGSGFFPDQFGASRFLGQATLGADYEAIQNLTQVGINNWIDQQVSESGTSYFDMAYNTREQWYQAQLDIGVPETDVDFAADILEKTFWQKTITENDLLRQRVTLALSEILVVSKLANDIHEPFGLATYLDVLHRNAFGNYKDLLFEVTMHPCMALYLTYFRNKKSDPIINTRPDENYARELMQLFTIGIHELNLDGTEKEDNNGNPIPTYNNEDIKEFAKIFTGLYPSGWNHYAYEGFGDGTFDSDDYYNPQISLYDKSIPLTMYEPDHEQGEKHLLNNFVVPNGQSGIEDIQDAIDNLFNHPNVGPFLGYRLIQFLVKSNPTPAYVKRVAMAFNNDENGVRGNMEAVIRAILTDPEARDCEWLDDPRTGKMRETLVRNIHLYRAFNISNPINRYWKGDFHYRNDLDQSILTSPSVFNFFAPSYQPFGIVTENNMVAPEFQIVNEYTAIAYFNDTEDNLFNTLMPAYAIITPGGEQDYISTLDLNDEINILNNQGPGALVDRLNLILCHGQLSNNNKVLIIDGLNQLIDNSQTSEDIVKYAIYFIMTSPDYVIIK